MFTRSHSITPLRLSEGDMQCFKRDDVGHDGTVTGLYFCDLQSLMHSTRKSCFGRRKWFHERWPNSPTSQAYWIRFDRRKHNVGRKGALSEVQRAEVGNERNAHSPAFTRGTKQRSRRKVASIHEHGFCLNTLDSVLRRMRSGSAILEMNGFVTWRGVQSIIICIRKSRWNS